MNKVFQKFLILILVLIITSICNISQAKYNIIQISNLCTISFDTTSPKLSVLYGNLTENNTVNVTISSNETLQELAGWTLSEDKKSLKKTFNENITEDLIVKDINGNETIITIKITNIIVEQALDILYEKNEDNLYTIVFITSNRKIDNVAGYNRQDENTIYKVYTENCTETIQIGNKTQVIEVSNISNISTTVHFHTNNCYQEHNHAANNCSYHTHNTDCYTYTCGPHQISLVDNYAIHTTCPVCGKERGGLGGKYGYTCENNQAYVGEFYSLLTCVYCNDPYFRNATGQQSGNAYHVRTGSILRCGKTNGYQCGYTTNDTKAICNIIATDIKAIMPTQVIYENNYFVSLAVITYLDGHKIVAELENDYPNTSNVVNLKYTGLYKSKTNTETVLVPIQIKEVSSE